MATSGSLKKIACLASRGQGRGFSTSGHVQKQVTILGAAGGIGQPLSLLLKQNPLVTQLNLYDLVNCMGVSMELQHCATAKANVSGFQGWELKQSLKGSDLVIIPAGIPPRPGVSSEDNFNTNASIVSNLATAIAESCPNALVAIISNPVNSMVPIVSEIFKQWNVYNPAKVFGVTSLNTERAASMIGKLTGLPAHAINCPVIGGHSGTSIIPVFSQCAAAKALSAKQRKELTNKIRTGNDDVMAAKKGAAGPTLSVAFAASRFCNSVLRGLEGEKDVVECAYVRSDITWEDERNVAKVTETTYFTTPVVLGKEGIHKNKGIGALDEAENGYMTEAIREIKYDIERGQAYVKTRGASSGDAKLKEEMEKRN